MSRPRTTPRDRPARARVCAWLAVVLWILGVEVAPNLHLGLHDVLAPHTHGVAEHVESDHGHDHWFELDLDAHEHGADHDHGVEHGHDHGVEHGHDHAEVADAGPHGSEFAGVRVAAEDLEHAAGADDARVVAPARAVASRLDPGHGDHDLLHRGIAIACPPLAALSVAQADVVVLARLHPRSDRPFTRALGRPRARGPPTSSPHHAVDRTA
ncbi:MAG: hypothetical protein JNK45_34675 [Myxococcales bacterium]|nr:hypothetical protein [Myxococcales bacterium]